VTVLVSAIQRRLDEIAIDQLRAEVVRLHEELESTRSSLANAEDVALTWQREASYLRDCLDAYEFKECDL
jgi:hypothetical protein